MSHEDTIGTIEYDGKTWEIDWPYELENPDDRVRDLAAIYLDGEQVAEVCPPGFGVFETEDDVMEAAHHALPGIAAHYHREDKE